MRRIQFSMNRERDIHINAYSWQPKNIANAKAVIQLSHGMAEHILRYEEFCAFFVEVGFIIYGNDHRGHGDSIIAPDDKGFFADENGFEKVVGDMLALSAHINEQHPDLPLILFGHSMGSFLSRRYIQQYGKGLAGVILSGTGGNQGMAGKIGLLVAKWESHRIGRRTPSPLMNKLIFGNFNKSFKPVRTAFDFLSRDETVVDTYMEDNRCGFICSSGFYVDLLSGIDMVNRNEKLGEIPIGLPIFLIAGDKDPVGAFGKGVREVYEQYNRHGVYHLSMKLYPDARHEILNEINKHEVFADIRDWIDTVI